MAFAFVGSTGTSAYTAPVVTFTRSFTNGNGALVLVKMSDVTTPTGVRKVTDQAGNLIPFHVVSMDYYTSIVLGYALLWIPQVYMASFATSSTPSSQTTAFMVTLATTASGSGAAVSVAEFSGLTTSPWITVGNAGSLNQSAPTTANGIVGPTLTPTIQPGGSGALLFAASINYVTSGSGTAPTAGTGFTAGTTWSAPTAFEYERITSNTPVTATFNNTSGASSPFLTISVIIDEAPPEGYQYVGSTSNSTSTNSISRAFQAHSNALLYIAQFGVGALATLTDQSGNAVPFTIVGSWYNASYSNATHGSLVWIPDVGAATTELIGTITGGTPTSDYWKVDEFTGLTKTLAITAGNSSNVAATATNATNGIVAGAVTPTLAGYGAMVYSVTQDTAAAVLANIGTGYTGNGLTGPFSLAMEHNRVINNASVAPTFTNMLGTSGATYQTFCVVIDESGTAAVATASGTSAVAANPASPGVASGSSAAVGVPLGGIATGVATGTSTATANPAQSAVAYGGSTVYGFSATKASASGTSTAVAIVGVPETFAVGVAFSTSTAVAIDGTPPPYISTVPLRTVRAVGGICPPPKSMPVKTPLEKVAVGFDFSSFQLPAGVVIVTADANIGVFSGVDNPLTTLESQTCAVNPIGGMQVSCIFSAGTSMTNYQIECLALCSDGESLSLMARQFVYAPVAEVPPDPPVDPNNYLVTNDGSYLVTNSGLYLVL